MLHTAIWVLRVANVINWIAAALVMAGALFPLADPQMLDRALDELFTEPASADAARFWLLALLATTVPVAIAAHLIFTRLVAMLCDTQIGAAFSAANAARLTTIAWALLAINIADLAFGRISIWASAQSSEYFGWSPSLTGWFAVPLLLILARIFTEGAAMRDDLEGTV